MEVVRQEQAVTGTSAATGLSGPSRNHRVYAAISNLRATAMGFTPDTVGDRPVQAFPQKAVAFTPRRRALRPQEGR